MKICIHLILFAVIATLVITSCDPGRKPNIAFKKDAGYTSSNASVNKGDTVKIGINASKAEKTDVPKTFNLSVSFDGAAPTSLSQVSLTGTQGDNYDQDFKIIARQVAGSEKYTFTVTNRDGLIGQITLTLTVN